MKKHVILLAVIMLVPIAEYSYGQCTVGETAIIVDIVPDNYGSEITWNIIDYDGSPTYGSGGPYTDGNTTPVSDTVCVPTGTMVTFTINDSYGDGICCNEGIGSYTVTVNGYAVAAGGQYGYQETSAFLAPPVSFDVGITSINLDPIVAIGTNTISGTFKNYGITTLTSLNINYSVNGGAPSTYILSGVNIAPFSDTSFTHPTQWVSSTTGNYSIKIWVTDLNGNPDMNNLNDTLTATCLVAYYSTQRLPLLEEFSSSTATPCANFDVTNGFDQLLSNNGANTVSGDVTAVKYQMNWPSPSNDPSYNSHGNSRRTYYSISAIPDVLIDGIDYSEMTPASDMQPFIDERRNKPTFIEIFANHTITGNTVSITAKIIPYFDISPASYVLYFAVVQDYYYPQSTTTQDDYHYVMRKMLPNANGTAITSFSAYDIMTFTQSSVFTISGGTPAQGSFDLWGTINNIQVVVWIQDANTHEVLQSAVSQNCSSSSLTASVSTTLCGAASITVTGGSSPYSYFWDDIIGQSTSVATGLSGDTINALIVDNDHCFRDVSSTDTISVPICLVTVDSLSQNNIIVWDKTFLNPGDSVFIYRDTANNDWGLIGKVPYDSLSLFIDTVRTLYAANGDPNVSTWRYKIAVNDSCGSNNSKSSYHQSIYIQNSSGNFSWNHYQIEGQAQPVPALSNYLFQRDDFSTGNYITIQTLSASSAQYTDPQYATYQNMATWRVITAWSISCTPALQKLLTGTINTTRSNSFKQGIIIGMNENSPENEVRVFPNPNNGKIQVAVAGDRGSKYEMEIYNVFGEKIERSVISNREGNITINLIDAPNGVYFLKVILEDEIVYSKKIIIY